MNRNTDAALDEGFDLSLETLDQWESELDQFSAAVMARLSELKGIAIDSRATKSQSTSPGKCDSLGANPPDDSEALRLLESLRELSQSNKTQSW